MPLLEVLGLRRPKAPASPLSVAPAGPRTAQVPQAQPANRPAEYATKRRECLKLLAIFKRLKDDPQLQQIRTRLDTIDAQVQGGRLPVERAIVQVDQTRMSLGVTFANVAVAQPTARLTLLKRSPAAAFLAGDIQQLETLGAEVLAAANRGDHARALLGAKQLRALVETAEDVAQRRTAYDAQRDATVAALVPLRGQRALQAQVAALDQQVAAADALATRAAMRFEHGLADLQQVAQRAASLQQVAVAGDALAQERAASQRALAALRKHAAARAIAGPLAAVEGLLAPAAGGAADDPAALERARAGVAQASADLAALATMADSLAAGLRGVAPGSKAAARLVAQAEHRRYAALRAPVEQRLGALRALPLAAAIAGRIDAVAQALAQAAQHDAANAGGPAIAALHAAEDAARVAEAAASARAAFDRRIAEMDAGKARLLEGDAGVAFEKRVLKARAQADAFDFEAAGRTLDAAQAGLEKLTVMEVAVLDPASPALLDGARRLLKLGGAKQLDEVVAALPTSVPDRVITQLAKERFGIAFEVAAGTGTAPVKQIYAMLAKVPEHVLGNPSLKTIRAVAKPAGTALGGQYMADSEAVEIYERPDRNRQQAFGGDLKNDQGRPQLPADVEESCRPADPKPVPLMDWTTLHEIGHSLDDASNFMRSQGRDDAHGGWIEYGAKIEPIADAVAAWAHYDETDAQKRYVVELILGNEPAVPPPPAGREKEARRALSEVQRWYRTATQAEVWKDEAATRSMCIVDRVYQMPYPDEWVSYQIAARRHGLTGFQFKAPGEWFAELYAGWKSGKLRAGHPALRWLPTIGF